MIRALLLDLDDTLYDEASYVRSGFRAVAGHLARRLDGADEDALARSLMATLQRQGRGKVFDTVLAAHGVPPDRATIEGLVRLYRRHAPEIALDAGALAAIRRLSGHFLLAVVTDGDPVMQRRKVAALDLGSLVPVVVYCWEHAAPKPNPGGFALALQRLGVTSDHALIVGDDPRRDLPAAATLGVPMVRVRRGRHAAVPNPDGLQPVGEIDAFRALPGWLESRGLLPRPADAAVHRLGLTLHGASS